ncbi:hypothetical protein OY671_007594 [Metschnikowia pulcherrima]|nr:hypothetical protein OY671_007594 [Metschnikowia pulcherrima]
MSKKLYPDAAAALDGSLRDGSLITCGGFGSCGVPERSLDAVRDSASEVSFAPRNASIGRVGARSQAEYQAGGATWKPYSRADSSHTSGGNDSVSFDGGTTSKSAMGGTQARSGSGMSVKASELVSVYASTGYGFNSGGERREMVQGNVGVQIRW